MKKYFFEPFLLLFSVVMVLWTLALTLFVFGFPLFFPHEEDPDAFLQKLGLPNNLIFPLLPISFILMATLVFLTLLVYSFRMREELSLIKKKINITSYENK